MSAEGAQRRAACMIFNVGRAVIIPRNRRSCRVLEAGAARNREPAQPTQALEVGSARVTHLWQRLQLEHPQRRQGTDVADGGIGERRAPREVELPQSGKLGDVRDSGVRQGRGTRQVEAHQLRVRADHRRPREVDLCNGWQLQHEQRALLERFESGKIEPRARDEVRYNARRHLSRKPQRRKQGRPYVLRHALHAQVEEWGGSDAAFRRAYGWCSRRDPQLYGRRRQRRRGRPRWAHEAVRRRRGHA